MEKKFGMNEHFVCEACKKELHHSCFGRKKFLASGHLGICKPCKAANPALRSKEHKAYEEAGALKESGYRKIHRLEALLFIDQWKLDHGCSECETPFGAKLPAHLYKLYRARPYFGDVRRPSVVVQRHGSREELVRALESCTVFCWKCYRMTLETRRAERRIKEVQEDISAYEVMKLTGVLHTTKEGIGGMHPMTTVEKQRQIAELKTALRQLPDGKRAKYEPKVEEVEDV